MYIGYPCIQLSKNCGSGFNHRNQKSMCAFGVLSMKKHGGDGRDRTDDLLRAKQALSQLSYTPAHIIDYTNVLPITIQMYWWARVELNH